jgi:hypothetical protein
MAVFPGGVWAILLIANVRTTPKISWTVGAMALLLWVMWRYLDGGGPPRSNSTPGTDS